ncbi:MAG: hypothetical protein GY865_12375, partial [candidate division Zixibacteria bacterium]|nr:hypothetical protein [candidate division Zixibacteria bacterium]
MKTVLSIFLQASSILLLSTFLLLSPFGTITSDATNYLSVKESTGITLGSGGIAVIGNITKNNRTKDGLSNWIKPLPGEKKIMSFLGGKYYPGKTNFLDNGFGSVATSFAAVPILIGLNAKWPRDEKEKDISQDLFLLSTGLLATNGITELFKGVFRRQRPLVSLYPQNISKEDK